MVTSSLRPGGYAIYVISSFVISIFCRVDSGGGGNFTISRLKEGNSVVLFSLLGDGGAGWRTFVVEYECDDNKVQSDDENVHNLLHLLTSRRINRNHIERRFSPFTYSM